MKLIRLIILSAIAMILISSCSTSNTSSASTSASKASAINTTLGLNYLEKGQFQRAQQKIRLAVQQHRSISSLTAMAYYYEQSHQFEQADKIYQQVIHWAPTSAMPHNNYGIFLCKQHHYLPAMKQFRIALMDKQYEKIDEIYQNAGYCALKQNKLHVAIQYYQSSILANPTNIDSIEKYVNICFKHSLFKNITRLVTQNRINVCRVSNSTRLKLQEASQRVGDKRLTDKLDSCSSYT